MEERRVSLERQRDFKVKRMGIGVEVMRRDFEVRQIIFLSSLSQAEQQALLCTCFDSVVSMWCNLRG